jgi:hypothetical protein
LIPYKDRKCKVLFKYTHTTNNSNMVHLQVTVTFIGFVLHFGMTYSQNVKLVEHHAFATSLPLPQVKI